MSERKFRVAMSERCYRFKPAALPDHAPHKPGVYEFVTFDAQKNAQVLYVGAALGRSVHDCLADHMAGRLAPTAQELFAVSPDIYFDFVAAADISDPEELKDIAGAFIAKSKPRFNTGPAPSSGKYQKVEVEELG
jgi:excinuclease UvrABC nuclease subunit